MYATQSGILCNRCELLFVPLRFYPMNSRPLSDINVLFVSALYGKKESLLSVAALVQYTIGKIFIKSC